MDETIPGLTCERPGKRTRTMIGRGERHPDSLGHAIIARDGAQSPDRIPRRHGVDLILEFGSMVRGHVHPRSDLGLAVLVDRPTLSFEELADLRHELPWLHPDHEVDVAIANHADPLFLKKITERGRLLHGSERRLAELKIYTLKRYQNHRRYLVLEREYVRRTLARLSS